MAAKGQFSPADPKGMIGESYAIDGIGLQECRSIFLDWALSLPADADPQQALNILFLKHGESRPDHPMTDVLRDGLAQPPLPRRRGGRQGRGD